MRSKEQRLKLLEEQSKVIKTAQLDYEVTFKPVLRQPMRCNSCNIVLIYHSERNCDEKDTACSKCRGIDHTAKDCRAHFSRFHCVNCDERGHGAYDKTRCPILKEIEKESTAIEMKRLREELGKPAVSKPTDPTPRSFSGVASNLSNMSLKQDLEQIKMHLQENNNKDLVKEMRKALREERTVARNESKAELKKFKENFSAEMDNKMAWQKYEIIKLLQDNGQLTNIENNPPLKLNFEVYDQLFKPFDVTEDDELDDVSMHHENGYSK